MAMLTPDLVPLVNLLTGAVIVLTVAMYALRWYYRRR